MTREELGSANLTKMKIGWSFNLQLDNVKWGGGQAFQVFAGTFQEPLKDLERPLGLLRPSPIRFA